MAALENMFLAPFITEGHPSNTQEFPKQMAILES
jgi:hypothetical protein